MGAIFLVRHGQASFGTADYDRLSDLGRRQARLVGAELARRNVRVDHAWCGSLSRQRATAELALAECAPGAVLKEDARWDEYSDAGVLGAYGGGRHQDASDPRGFQQVLESALTAWVAAGESGAGTESWPAFRARVGAALTDVAASLGKGEQAVVFTSGGVIATLCGLLLGTPETHLVPYSRVAVNAGITKVATGRGGTTLISFNEHGHFDGPAADLVSYR
ncbi:histidine phosphatase family protein [Prauserella rugosa]|uniref:Broad specificity phosphatase PhoE n=1 Tax=Prauserella rugosa TaxID=43354 RepID=A0A660C6E1_9PSEU|nr:histidine phosphatase family protein [Prauserella rugosa]KMS84383.1 fructose-2,6-bisphosphatase [Streptomyces regensis]TWH18906.1 broad specificity phosphatase PhoE [Prauserella rugosa]